MSDLPPATTDLRALLESAEAAAPTQAVEVVTHALADMVGARQVSFLIADLSGRAVVRFGQTGALDARNRETLQLDGTAYEQVLRTQQADLSRLGDGAQLILPVTDRGDAIGLLELLLPDYPTEQVVADVVAAAHALAYIVVANRRHTDLFEWGQRSTPFSLAAEIQRRLLPSSFTCEAGQFTVSAWMEPASSVGGDTFDYVLGEDALQLSITDAAGHDVAAALLATLLVGSLRNGRRGGLTLLEQACGANDALAAHSTVGQFVTGQLVRIDLHSRSATIVNASHPFPLRLRGGRVEEIELDIDLPFGIEEGRSYRLQEFPIAPGDRIVFLTDGMLERNAAEVDVAEVLAGSGDLHPREVVRALGAAVLRATGGELRDDATVMCLDWYGGPPRPRDSSGGASRLRASP
ncbi:serine/threonine-protein phosphatase [Pseudonocardia sp. KRD-184]|uniref:Serine/threonine-protein phosphatase n=1 Tax=Pseudonocardia oceani TaxID=2792013 RepID=A0ABS6UDG9_9PSEU|nr:PP2C family protein-serine/threonine phosphatase [Pseudonocardia oceani]MBW0090203.1 serine/threonine-protein phosphatase [Pseudonocardia oceani]MBW0096539.1 serine/threonine-protein phosphatase [Pseudonocardia oceani]MBW0109289.1 serine/threonine-protein phosphatase [Pseudonocardia oceani]MBW0123375.1 serine/threonine-protein phosphatase [Pseudonocardia oceani]MBW0130296.1 serine/threonine-protein phosphatase [Pseudonocardia oceani]